MIVRTGCIAQIKEDPATLALRPRCSVNNAVAASKVRCRINLPCVFKHTGAPHDARIAGVVGLLQFPILVVVCEGRVMVFSRRIIQEKSCVMNGFALEQVLRKQLICHQDGQPNKPIVPVTLFVHTVANRSSSGDCPRSGSQRIRSTRAWSLENAVRTHEFAPEETAVEK